MQNPDEHMAATVASFEQWRVQRPHPTQVTPEYLKQQAVALLAHFPSPQFIAKLDNNEIESLLKIVVRDRKNAMFHKTLNGATIGNVITSMIATATQAGVNVFEYFTVLHGTSRYYSETE
jgi:hypothetical protein